MNTRNDDEAINLRSKVAELCGSKRYERPWDGRVFLCYEKPGTIERPWNMTDKLVDVVNSDVPYYPTDLNAMHSAEKYLDRKIGGSLEQYEEKLASICGDTYEAMRATAAQRAEAFVFVMSSKSVS